MKYINIYNLFTTREKLNKFLKIRKNLSQNCLMCSLIFSPILQYIDL